MASLCLWKYFHSFSSSVHCFWLLWGVPDSQSAWLCIDLYRHNGTKPGNLTVTEGTSGSCAQSLHLTVDLQEIGLGPKKHFSPIVFTQGRAFRIVPVASILRNNLQCTKIKVLLWKPPPPETMNLISSSSIPRLSDQQNFNVSVENMLTRCLDNERSWRLHTRQGDSTCHQLLIEDSLPLVPEKKPETLVFPCILSALQWITQGRDSVLADSAKIVLPVKPSITAKAAPFLDVAEIHVLITGSLHLVGGVLKHFDSDSSK